MNRRSTSRYLWAVVVGVAMTLSLSACQEDNNETFLRDNPIGHEATKTEQANIKPMMGSQRVLPGATPPSMGGPGGFSKGSRASAKGKSQGETEEATEGETKEAETEEATEGKTKEAETPAQAEGETPEATEGETPVKAEGETPDTTEPSPKPSEPAAEGQESPGKTGGGGAEKPEAPAEAPAAPEDSPQA